MFTKHEFKYFNNENACTHTLIILLSGFVSSFKWNKKKLLRPSPTVWINNHSTHFILTILWPSMIHFSLQCLVHTYSKKHDHEILTTEIGCVHCFVLPSPDRACFHWIYSNQTEEIGIQQLAYFIADTAISMDETSSRDKIRLCV